MLSHQSATKWFSKILENDQSGNCEQKVLGLRRIFDSVLLEMFPNISDQGFYMAAIDKIFTTPIGSKYGTKESKRLQREFHSLRKYLNSVQHSQIEADIVGYVRSLRRLAVLIAFCATTHIPDEISTLVGKGDHKNRNIAEQFNSSDTSHPKDDGIHDREKVSPIFIFDRGTLKNAEVIKLLENEIDNLCNKIGGEVNKFIVTSMNRNELLLSLPLSRTKHRFTYPDDMSVLNLRPLHDFITNAHISKFAVFYLSDANSTTIFEMPSFLSASLFTLTIGILDDSYHDLSKKNRFDKLVKLENLSRFFNWSSIVIGNL